MAKVTIGLPNNGWAHRYVVESLLEMVTRGNGGHHLTVDLRTGRPLEHTRNLIVKAFLESGNDVLLMIDSDNPPQKNPLELVALDKDILILPTPMWKDDIAARYMGHNPVRWNVYDSFDPARGWIESVNKGEGLKEIEAGGTGSILIARRVLEQVRPAFLREFDADGLDYKGSDLLFCQRAKACGFNIWTHYDYWCHHYKQVDLAEVNNAIVVRDIACANQPDINTPTYWDGEWAKRSARILPVYPLIVEMVGGKRVLDYGCGRGDLLAMLGDGAWGMDHSREALERCGERGLKAMLGYTWPNRVGNDDRRTALLQSAALAGLKDWDAVTCTEVLEHVDDDAGLLAALHEVAPLVIYSVPHDCLPPGLEPEHRRVYTHQRVREITPHLKDVIEVGDYLLVVSERKQTQ